MSDRMTPIPFGRLFTWITTEMREHKSIFAIEEASFYRSPEHGLPLFGSQIETPFGPAAGPNTQLTQNIVAAYITGSRFFELKTVQKLDGEDLPVSKPCILAKDECYNVEWSTELRVEQAFAEYVKAWWLLKLLAKGYGFGHPDHFVFNISVGYDFEGICLPKIDNFIEGMKDASNTAIWKECREWALANIAGKKIMDNVIDADFINSINPHVCNSITLSTLHGCPPQEIERIASYLIDTKHLNTFVKCNPTLLGYQTARRILDNAGYDYIVFDDHHFLEDLQYTDAIPMFKRLRKLAALYNVEFGVKLTNTFPVDVAAQELPGNEMYMSGRSLYLLSLELAKRLAQEFDGQMRISYSGGADQFNIAPLFEAGIWPITMATTILKPGGYQRLQPIAQAIEKLPFHAFDGIKVDSVKYLADWSKTDPHHQKPIKPMPSRKIAGKVPVRDCFTAPCNHGCPINQDIPEYIKLVGEKRYYEALRLITAKNPLPFMTGTICAHHCMDKCSRNFYESPVYIRQVKLEAAFQGYDSLMANLPKVVGTSNAKVAVVGGGPAGLSVAYFVTRGGAQATIFEREKELGGIPRHVIPEFRIGNCAIRRDAQLATAYGAEVKLGADAPSLAELQAQGYTHVVYATGAQGGCTVRLAERDTAMVTDANAFMANIKDGSFDCDVKNIVVIGGGNTAMDAARAAKRIKGVQKVSLVYRRTRRYMPAEEEELVMALEDGVEFCELLTPYALKGGQLICHKIVLGEPDASGRRAPVETAEEVAVACDLLVAATGAKVDGKFFADQGLEVTERGRVVVNPDTLQSNVANVYVIGDANRGPATIVEAIADAQKVANAIVGPYTYAVEPLHGYAEQKQGSLAYNRGVMARYHNARHEHERCLECSAICEHCVQACPNRAYVPIYMEGAKMPLILHLDALCNECGNCAVFCPYESAPYKEKMTLFSTEKELLESVQPGFYMVDETHFKVRPPQEMLGHCGGDSCPMPVNGIMNIELGKGQGCECFEMLIKTIKEKYGYLLHLLD